MGVNNSWNNVQLPFGLRNGELVHVRDVPSGLSSGCRCAACDARLIARKGPIKTHHFAHYKSEACSHGFETALHYAAKMVLQESLEIRLPGHVIQDRVEGVVDGQKYTKIGSADVCDTVIAELDRVELEKPLDTIVPDVIAYINNEPLLIEIAVTHFIDERKEGKIHRLEYPTIEIDLSDIGRGIDLQIVRERVISSIENKKWVFHRNEVSVRNLLKFCLSQELAEELEGIRLKNIEDEKRAAKQQKLLLAIAEKNRQLIRRNIKRARHYLNDLAVIQEKHSNELVESVLWRRIEYLLKVNQKTLPEFLNTPIKGELAFSCDRRLWQAGLFMAFINNKFHKYNNPYPISLERIIKWCQKNVHMNEFALELWSKKKMLNAEELNLLSNFDSYNAIREFLKHLESKGFIRYLYSNQYKIINDRPFFRSVRQNNDGIQCIGVNNEWVTSLTEDYQERFQERAAIYEYCGGINRDEAENLAYLSLFSTSVSQLPKH